MKKDQLKALRAIMTLASMVVLGFLVYFFIVAPFFKSSKEGVTGFFENKADHKAHCQTHETVTNAKTDFAAKQAYEKCINDN